MVIIRLTGGLGNQMFQYAAGRATAIRNRTILLLDTTYYDTSFTKQGHESELLINLFPAIKAMSLPRINQNVIADIVIENSNFAMRSFNKVCRVLDLKPNYYNLIETSLLTYQPAFRKAKANILHLSSDWQNEKYFFEYASEIKNDFEFPDVSADSLNAKYLKLINTSNAVSLHVRRGDYLSSTMHQVTSLSYYQKSIELVSSKVLNPKFFVFSDDIDWCKNNLNIQDALYVGHNSGTNSYFDMQLMSNCKHNIIANSSFSWWGAWLNKNPDKIVIAPELWLAKSGILAQQVVPDAWTILKD